MTGGAQYSFIRLGIIRVPKVKMAILNNVSTLLRPGRPTLVLGPPGAGKSTLLKAMAGKLEHGGLKVSDLGLTPAVLPIFEPSRHPEIPLSLLHNGHCQLYRLLA